MVIGKAVQHILRPMCLNRRFKRLPDTLQSVFFSRFFGFSVIQIPEQETVGREVSGFTFCHKIGVLLIGADSAVGIEVHPSHPRNSVGRIRQKRRFPTIDRVAAAFIRKDFFLIKLHNLIAGEDIRSGWRDAMRNQSLRTPVKSVPVVCISVFIYMFFGAVAVADQPVERFVLKAHAMAVSFSVEINAVYMVFIQSGKENEVFVR